MVATHAIERGLTLHPLLFCTDEMVYRGQKLDMSSIKCCYNFITFQTSGKFLLRLSIVSQIIIENISIRRKMVYLVPVIL